MRYPQRSSPPKGGNGNFFGLQFDTRYVVKPVDFAQFAEAIRHVGVFWTLTSEPPPA